MHPVTTNKPPVSLGPNTSCVVFEGFCNRINAMASALAMSQNFKLVWCVNDHCPLRYEDLLLPIAGVEVQEVCFQSFPYHRRQDLLCWFYLANPSGSPKKTFQTRIKSAYRTIIQSLKHRSGLTLPADCAGLTFREFLPHRSRQPLLEFLLDAEKWLQRKQATHVFICSDSQAAKDALLTMVASINANSHAIDCSLLSHDLKRSDDNLFGLSQELDCLSQCRLGILSNSARSTIGDSARGFNVKVERTFDSRRDRRDEQLERWVNERAFVD